MARALSLAVLESRWEDDINLAVRPMFELLSHLMTRSYDQFYYDRFVSIKSFEDTARFLVRSRGVQCLYVASHGYVNKKGNAFLQCPNKEEISRTVLRNDVLVKTNLRGLFIGSCEFLTASNAEFLMSNSNSKTNPLKWVAGYKETVDCLESTILDALFLYHYFHAKSDGNSVYNSVGCAVENLNDKVSGLVNHLKLNVYARKRGRTGGIEGLLGAD